MAKKSQEMQAIIKRYKLETGIVSADMHDVAKYAADMGWPLPKPRTAIDRLAEQFSSAAREETERDEISGRPYRVNLAVTTWNGHEQETLWTEIDVAPRHIAHKSLQQRREQMVGAAVNLTDDAEHWNRVHPTEEPLQIELDFSDDVEWRKNAPSDDEEKAA